MRRPFEKLVEMVDEVFASEEAETVTIGDLALRWEEPMGRITDAIDTSKMLRGKRTYISLEEP